LTVCISLFEKKVSFCFWKHELFFKKKEEKGQQPIRKQELPKVITLIRKHSSKLFISWKSRLSLHSESDNRYYRFFMEI